MWPLRRNFAAHTARHCAPLTRAAERGAVVFKGDVDLVTATDREVERQIFAAITDAYPTHKRIGEEAVAAGTLSEQLTEGLRFHRKRYERHMIDRREWSMEDWQKYVLEHPFMRLYARNLLWSYRGLHQLPGEKRTLFHVCEDLSLADEHDEHLELPIGCKISIAHVLDLTTEEVRAWSNLFADYEKIPPFQQLDRERYDIGTLDHDNIYITHFANTTFAPRSLRTYFKYHGYDRGYSDSYLRRYYTKVFEGHGVRLDLELDPGLQVGTYEGDVEQHIVSLSFRRVVQRGIQWVSKDQLSLEDVPDILINEALRDVAQIQHRT